MKNRNIKRLTSWVLTIALLLSVMPIMALASLPETGGNPPDTINAGLGATVTYYPTPGVTASAVLREHTTVTGDLRTAIEGAIQQYGFGVARILESENLPEDARIKFDASYSNTSYVYAFAPGSTSQLVYLGRTHQQLLLAEVYFFSATELKVVRLLDFGATITYTPTPGASATLTDYTTAAGDLRTAIEGAMQQYGFGAARVLESENLPEDARIKFDASYANTSHVYAFAPGSTSQLMYHGRHNMDILIRGVYFFHENELKNTAYIITLDPNGGNLNVTSLSTNDDGRLLNLPIPTRSGFDFDGWFTALAGGTRVTTNTVFTERTTIYARWSERVVDSGESGSDSGSSGGGGGSTTTTTGGSTFTGTNVGGATVANSTTGVVTQTFTSTTGAAATTAINSAVSAAIASVAANSSATVTPTFRNVGEVSASVLAAIDNAAGSRSVTVQFDSMVGNAVDVRVYVSPSAVAAGASINVSASTTSPAAQKTTSTFSQFFSNPVATVALGQQGSFGANVGVAARVDLTGMNTANLVFYSYNAATNTFVTIPTANYRIDANGYLHFNTSAGGNIVVSNGSLVRR